MWIEIYIKAQHESFHWRSWKPPFPGQLGFPTPTINVELIVHVQWDQQKKGSVANLESLKPNGRHREREHSESIICTGYRKGRRAPSCWGDSHKSRNWGQGGNYQKSHLCVMQWAKSQAHSRFSGQNGVGVGVVGGQGSGPVVLLWGPGNQGKMQVAEAAFRRPAKPTSWLGFPTHKSINWSQHGQRGEAPFSVGELNFQISLQENILTKSSQPKPKTISCVIKIPPSALKCDVEHMKSSE